MLVLLIALVALLVAWQLGYIDRWLYESSLQKAGEASSAVSTGAEEEASANMHLVYSRLSEDDQKKYRIVLAALETREEQPYTDDGMDDLNRIFQCVQADHPELFYVDGVSMETVTNRGNGLVERVTIRGRFAYSEEEARARWNQIETAAEACLSGIPAGSDEYAISKYLYEWLAENVVYDHDLADTVLLSSHEENTSTHRVSQTVEGALLNGLAVCGGYASAYQLLLQKLGMQCACVTGYGNGAPHAWCLAQLDGSFYYIDPTWADPQAINERQELGYVNYDFLNITTADLLRTHEITALCQLPNCTEVANNYYVREGLLFESADEIRLGTTAADAMIARVPLQVRFVEEADYCQIRDYFIANGRLSSYLPRGTYQYSFSDANQSIVILGR